MIPQTNTSPDLASQQESASVACFTIISNASSDTVQNGWHPPDVVAKSRERNKAKNLKTQMPTHKITRTRVQIRYESSKRGGARFRRRPDLLGTDMGMV